MDIEQGSDGSDLSGWGFTSLTGAGATGAGGAQFTMVDDANGDAFIALGYNTWITVKGVSSGKLTESDFLLA